jgi:hypothetical protein
MVGVKSYDAGHILSSGDRRLYSITSENSNGTVLGSSVSNPDLIGIKFRLLVLFIEIPNYTVRRLAHMSPDCFSSANPGGNVHPCVERNCWCVAACLDC